MVKIVPKASEYIDTGRARTIRKFWHQRASNSNLKLWITVLPRFRPSTTSVALGQ